MKAVLVEAFGEPEVLAYREVADPTPKDDEVLIRTEAISVNFADIKARKGVHHLDRPLPFIPGLDAAGVIAAAGRDVHGLEVGQRVAAAAIDGSYAEFMLARPELVFPLPDALESEAAAGIVGAITAYNVLHRVGGLTKDDRVLVHAAAGGVGSLILQLARLHGVKQTIGLVGSDDKFNFALAHGADQVVNYSQDDWVRKVKELTEGKGVSLILDPVAGNEFHRNWDILGDFGRIVIFGEAAGEPGQVDTKALYSKNRAALGYSSGHYRKHRPREVRPAAQAMIGLLAGGEVQVSIGASLSLVQAAEAHRLIESRRSTGKLLLRP